MKQNKVGYRKNNSLEKTTVQEKQHYSQNIETKKETSEKEDRDMDEKDEDTTQTVT